MNAPEALTWFAFHLLLLDYLADSWRWWSAMGAIVALPPVLHWIVEFVRSDGRIAYFEGTTRLILAIALTFGLIGNISAGAIIPLATDGRISWLSIDADLTRAALAVAWLAWGCLSWTIAIAFARFRWRMAAASIAWFMACYIGAGLSMGAKL